MANQLSVLRNRSLLMIGISESVSNIGNWITMMVIFAMIIFKGEGSVLQSSAVFLAGLLPLLVFSPAAGWLSDRFDRKHLMIASELLAGASIAGLIFVRQQEWIFALIALQAVFVSWMQPARQAAVPDIVSPEDLPRANALLQQLNGIIKIFAPMLAGAVLVVLNPHQAIILDVVSFALSALILSRLPSLPPHRRIPAASAEEVAPRAPAANLLSVLRGLPMLRLLFVAMFLAISIIIGFDILAPLFTRDVMAGDESLFGLAISLVGAGTLVATFLLLLRRQRRPDAWTDLLAGLALLAVIPFSLSLASSTGSPITARYICLVGCFIGGIGNGLVNVQVSTLLQQLTPAEYLGRMSGIFQATAVGGQLFGMLVTPLIVPAVLAIPLYFLVSGLLLVVLVGYTGIARRKSAAAAAMPVTGQD